MPQEILYEIYGEIRETRAELKAHRENSDERHRSVHKRMDRLEDHFRSEIKDLREDKPPPSSTSSFAMLAAIFKMLEALFTHRAKIVWGASMLAALWGVKNPELLRVELQKNTDAANKVKPVPLWAWYALAFVVTFALVRANV